MSDLIETIARLELIKTELKDPTSLAEPVELIRNYRKGLDEIAPQLFEAVREREALRVERDAVEARGYKRGLETAINHLRILAERGYVAANSQTREPLRNYIMWVAHARAQDADDLEALKDVQPPDKTSATGEEG